MYTAMKPMFEFLYAYINENFWEGTVSDEDFIFYSRNPTSDEDELGVLEDVGKPRPLKIDRIFRNFYRGPILLENLPDDAYPVSWLEFGQTTDVELDRSPQGYAYGLRYQMPIMVKGSSAYSGPVPLQTFRDNLELERGLGDIISEVVGKVWSELHLGFAAGGNFEYDVDRKSFFPVSENSGQLRLSSTNWWIKNWSVDVNGEVVDTISEWSRVLDTDPTARAKTINWDFTIFEQEPLELAVVDC